MSYENQVYKMCGKYAIITLLWFACIYAHQWPKGCLLHYCFMASFKNLFVRILKVHLRILEYKGGGKIDNLNLLHFENNKCRHIYIYIYIYKAMQ